MLPFEQQYEENVGVFTVRGYSCYDDTPLKDNFNESYTDLVKLAESIDNGSCVYFIAKVTCSCQGVELAETYLGTCVYDSYDDFFGKEGYYEDMRDEVIAEATRILNNLKQVVI